MSVINSSSSSTRVAVIGGGPGGLAAAARLAEAGVSVDLFEASGELGGLARSLPLWGRELELSAHIFRSSDEFVNRLWRDCSGELVVITLRRGIFDGKGIIEYPISPVRILQHLGMLDTFKSVLGLCMGRLSQRFLSAPRSAEDWMVCTYGKPLHERFLRDYAEKLWGVPCDQIGASFPQFLFQSADDSRSDHSFLYPKLGNSSVWNCLGEQLVEQGVTIHKNTRVGQLDIVDSSVTGLVVDDEQFQFDHVISTMPLGLLARLALRDNAEVQAAASVLRARSTMLVYLHAESGSDSNFNWVSVYPPHFRMGRVTDFGQWLGSTDGSTVYCIEYWCDIGDELWMQSDDDLAALAAAELNDTKLVGKVSVMESHVKRVPNTHPVFSIDSQDAIETINCNLDTIKGLTSVGRHGAHGVQGMGESMEAAKKVADMIIGSGNPV